MFEEQIRLSDSRYRAKLRRMSDEQLDALIDHIADPRFRGQCPDNYGSMVALEMHRRKDVDRVV